jgi:hypothetical protein
MTTTERRLSTGLPGRGSDDTASLKPRAPCWVPSTRLTVLGGNDSADVIISFQIHSSSRSVDSFPGLRCRFIEERCCLTKRVGHTHTHGTYSTRRGSNMSSRNRAASFSSLSTRSTTSVATRSSGSDNTRPPGSDNDIVSSNNSSKWWVSEQEMYAVHNVLSSVIAGRGRDAVGAARSGYYYDASAEDPRTRAVFARSPRAMVGLNAQVEWGCRS